MLLDRNDKYILEHVISMSGSDERVSDLGAPEGWLGVGRVKETEARKAAIPGKQEGRLGALVQNATLGFCC